VRSAPRYDPRILSAVRELDRPGQALAETCRLVADRAGELGLSRPSYSHLRTYVVEERERVAAEQARRDEIREIIGEVATDLLVGRVVDAYEVADRIAEAGR
jgi:hypothetical protein